MALNNNYNRQGARYDDRPHYNRPGPMHDDRPPNRPPRFGPPQEGQGEGHPNTGQHSHRKASRLPGMHMQTQYSAAGGSGSGPTPAPAPRTDSHAPRTGPPAPGAPQQSSIPQAPPPPQPGSPTRRSSTARAVDIMAHLDNTPMKITLG
ncbi:hypothetical protein ABBQ32_005147 [Trebouxia sp. C0010 RCD-2024]